MLWPIPSCIAAWSSDVGFWGMEKQTLVNTTQTKGGGGGAGALTLDEKHSPPQKNHKEEGLAPACLTMSPNSDQCPAESLTATPTWVSKEANYHAMVNMQLNNNNNYNDRNSNNNNNIFITKSF